MMPVIFFGGTVIFFFRVKKDVDSCTFYTSQDHVSSALMAYVARLSQWLILKDNQSSTTRLSMEKQVECNLSQRHFVHSPPAPQAAGTPAPAAAGL